MLCFETTRRSPYVVPFISALLVTFPSAYGDAQEPNPPLEAETVQAADAPPAGPLDALQVLYHADVDGRFAQPDCTSAKAADRPSFARLISLIDHQRAQAKAVGASQPVVLLGGNIAIPDLLGRSFVAPDNDRVPDLVKLLARGAYDAITLGHHDLSLSRTHLQRLIEGLADHSIPVLLTNLVCDPEREALCQRTRRQVMVQRPGGKVGVIATLSPSVLSGVAVESRIGIRLEDPLTSIRTTTRSLREQGAKFVVLMVQGPRDQRALEELDLLQRGLADDELTKKTETKPVVPDVLLVGGLTDDEGNRAMRLLQRQDSPPAVGSQTGATGLTQVHLHRDPQGKNPVEIGVDRIVPEAPTIGAPAEVDRPAEDLLAPAIAAYCREYQSPVSPAPVRGTLTRADFTGYALEVMRRRAGSEIALLNRAAIKAAPFPLEGPITRGHLYSALPYTSVIGTARVPGSMLATLLGPAIANPKASVVGIEKEAGQVLVNGRPIDKARNYQVATISFVASGGDGIVDASALAWKPLKGDPDLREAIEGFLTTETGRRDHDPGVDPKTDFGPAPNRRLLLVGLMDGGLDIADTRIGNGPEYGDPQLTRGTQRVWKSEWTGILQTRQALHESDTRLNLKYGWIRSEPAGAPVSSTENTDLITFNSAYNYRGLRGNAYLPRVSVPDPYVRAALESEFTRPDVSATQTRTYHHFEFTGSLGALWTLTPSLKVRGGVGMRKELLTETAPFGRWRPVFEAGTTLSPIALASLGPLAVRMEGLVDYTFADPSGIREHRLRGNGRLSIPLLPLLFVTVGVDVFAVQREGHGWGTSYDTTIGLRIHLDAAKQWL